MRRHTLPIILAGLVMLVATSILVSTNAQEDQRLDLIQSGAMFALETATQDAAQDEDDNAFFAAILNARFGPVGSDQSALQSWLENHPDADPRQLSYGWRILGERMQFDKDYAIAAHALTQAVEIGIEVSQDLRDAADFAGIAADAPPTRSIGADGTVVELTFDLARLMRGEVSSNGATRSMVFDTGAEVSVVPASVAAEFGMRQLEGDVRVGTPTDDVTGALAIADEITIGEMTFSGVLFLVVPDDQLTLNGGAYFIDGIIGLPVFSTAGRMAWENGGTRISLGNAAPSLQDTGSRMFWHMSGIGLRVGTSTGTQGPTFFDSGASRTQFLLPILDHLSDDQTAGLTTSVERVGTVAGSSDIEFIMVPEVAVYLDGSEAAFSDARIDQGEQGFGVAADLANLGSDNVRNADLFALDFHAMRYQVHFTAPDTAAE